MEFFIVRAGRISGCALPPGRVTRSPGPDRGAILVNRAGKRFVNEAANYNALGKALHAFDAGSHSYANLPYWMIIDQRYRDKYPVLNSQPGSALPSYMIQADTLEDLAAKAGIDPNGLAATVARFNDMVRKGHDDDFNRGDSTYDNFYMWGDPAFDPPHRTLGPIDQAPCYAVKTEAGALGTAGGPKTNGDAQVLDWSGKPIPGLYAAGNAMAHGSMDRRLPAGIRLAPPSR